MDETEDNACHKNDSDEDESRLAESDFQMKQNEDSDAEQSETEISSNAVAKKTKANPNSTKESKPGIIYLSTVPPGMNIKQIREYFEKFGPVHRSFLQPDKKGWKGKGKSKNQTFIEGWIEFRKRRHAKRAVATLNNNPVGGKKKKIYHDFLWNVKYLPGFHWVHLNERLAYERISMKQRLRTEISAVKRETEFFAKSIDLSKTLKKKGVIGKGSKPQPNVNDQASGNQREPYIQPTAQPINLPEKKPPANPDRASFLTSLFGKGI